MKLIAGADQSLSLYISEENVSWTFVLESQWDGANSDSCSVPTKDTILRGSMCGSEGVEEKQW